METVSSCTLQRPGGHHLTIGVGDFVSCIHDVEGSPPYLCRILKITKEKSTGVYMGTFQWLYRREDIPKKKLPSDLAPNEVFFSNHVDGDNPMESILDLCRIEFARKGQRRFVSPLYGNKLMPEDDDEETFYCNKTYNPNSQKFTSISNQDFLELQTNEHLLPSSSESSPPPPSKKKKPKQKQEVAVVEKPVELPMQFYSKEAEEEEYKPPRMPTPPLFNSSSPVTSAIQIHSPSPTQLPPSLLPKKPKSGRAKVTWADNAADITHEPIERVATPTTNSASLQQAPPPQRQQRLDASTTAAAAQSTPLVLVYEQRPPPPRLGALHLTMNGKRARFQPPRLGALHLTMNGKRARFQPPVSVPHVRTLNPYIFRHTGGMPTQPISQEVARAENTSSKAVQQSEPKLQDNDVKNEPAPLPSAPEASTELPKAAAAQQLEPKSQDSVSKDRAVPELPKATVASSITAASPEHVPSSNSSQDTPTKKAKRLKSMRMASGTLIAPPQQPKPEMHEETKEVSLGGNEIGPEHQADIPAFTPKHLCPANEDMVLYSPACLAHTGGGSSSTVKPQPKVYKEGDIFGVDILDADPNRNKFGRRRMMWCRTTVAENYVRGVPVDSAWPSDANDPTSFRPSERFTYSCAKASVFVGEHEREQALYRLSGQPFSNSLLYEPSLDFVCKGVDSAWQSWTLSEFSEYCEGMRQLGNRDAGYCDSEAQFLRVAERIKTKTTADVVQLFFAPKRNLSNHPLLSCLYCDANEGLIVCQRFSECKEALCKKCIKHHPGTSKREERQFGGTVFEQDRNSFFMCEQCSKGPAAASKPSYAKRRRVIVDEENKEKPAPPAAAAAEAHKEATIKKKRPSTSRAATAEPGIVGKPKAADKPKPTPKVVIMQQQQVPELPPAAAAAADTQQRPKVDTADTTPSMQQFSPKPPLPARIRAQPRLFPAVVTPPKPASAAVTYSGNDGFADDGMSAMQLILHPKTNSILESVERGEMDSAAALAQLKLLLMSQAQAWLTL